MLYRSFHRPALAPLFFLPSSFSKHPSILSCVSVLVCMPVRSCWWSWCSTKSPPYFVLSSRKARKGVG
uniref:Putative secreted protein n=1 Tax=Anopheles marajoara TaxID=58244 RepID=A0A2M4CFT7_9DIPT